MDLAGKTVLVTGATGLGVGVGAGVCQAVIQSGGRLLVNGREPARVERAAAQYEAAVPIVGDVSEPEDVDMIFETARREAGGVDYLVNNAGIGLSKQAHEAELDEWNRLHAVDVRAVWMLCKRYIRERLAAGAEGSIVNITSIHAHSTTPGYAVYAGAKAGVEGFTRGLAIEGGPHGIRCNAVAPGYVHADQNLELISTWSDDPQAWVTEHIEDQQAIPKLIEPIDCGWSVVFLLSNLSRCITGQTLRVDCGTTAMLYNRGFVS